MDEEKRASATPKTTKIKMEEERRRPNPGIQAELNTLKKICAKSKDSRETLPWYNNKGEITKEDEERLMLSKRTIEDFGPYEEMLVSAKRLSRAEADKHKVNVILREATAYRANMPEDEKNLIRAFHADYISQVSDEKTLKLMRTVFKKYGMDDLTTDQLMEAEHLGMQLPHVEMPVIAERQHPGCLKRQEKLAKTLLALNEVLNKNCPSMLAAANKYRISYSSLVKAKKQLADGNLRRKLAGGTYGATEKKRKYDFTLDRFIASQVLQMKGLVDAPLLQATYRVAYRGADYPSLTTIKDRMKELGFTRKHAAICPSQRNTMCNKEIRFSYVCKLIHATIENRLIISIDETGVNLDPPTLMHYAAKGQRLYCQSKERKVKNITCIFAIAANRVVQTQFLEGGCSSVTFFGFMKNLVEELEKRADLPGHKKPLLLLDNASIHRSRLLTALVSRGTVELLYTPSYSPMLNPVEFTNNRLKKWLGTRTKMRR